MTWLEPLIGAFASVIQKNLFDKITDKNTRLVIDVSLSAVLVFVYNFLMSNWFENIIVEITSAIGSWYLFYKLLFDKKDIEKIK